ncbi:MAG: RNA methyltransferase [bacterium]|nr:RNA methyltransferase [bacterium]MDT8395994.1 RNA methyltransferase [bacterium]
MPLPELSREKLRILRSLTSAKVRKRRGLCLVEGERALTEAFRSNRLKYLVTADKLSGKDRAALAGQHGVMADLPLYVLDGGSFEELSDVRAGTGLLGVAGIPASAGIDDLPGQGKPVNLFFLDAVQEPGNVGTLIRTAWALGLAGVLLGPGTADPFSRKAVRASAGGVFHLPLFEGVSPGDIDSLLARGFSLFFAERGGEDYRKVRYPDRSVLALGNEGAGTSDWVRERGKAVGVPMARGVDSLNVVVAGAILISAMKRESR